MRRPDLFFSLSGQAGANVSCFCIFSRVGDSFTSTGRLSWAQNGAFRTSVLRSCQDNTEDIGADHGSTIMRTGPRAGSSTVALTETPRRLASTAAAGW
jgi:hypothetical protein